MTGHMTGPTADRTAEHLTGHTAEHMTDQAAGRTAASEITGGTSAGVDPHDNRRQALYWRLLARLFDHEEHAALESASLAVVEDIGLPPALLDPQASVDSIVQRHPELAAEFDGLMTPGSGSGSEDGDPEGEGEGDRDRAAEVRRAALVSKVLLNVFASGSGTVTAGQLARWQSDAGWLERARSAAGRGTCAAAARPPVPGRPPPGPGPARPVPAAAVRRPTSAG